MKELLLLPQSKNNVLKVVKYIGDDRDRYAELIKYIIDNNGVTANRASWAMSHCYDNKVGFFIEYLSNLLPILEDEYYSNSIKRNIVRVLQFVEIPEKHQGQVINSCFNLLNDREKPSAVLAFSMGVLHKMVKIYPELKNELKFSIEEIMPNATSGVKNRGRNILKSIP